MQNNNDGKKRAKSDSFNVPVSESETYSADSEGASAKKSTERTVRADGKKYVEKGSLTEAELIADKMRAKTAKKTEDMTEEEKREERRAANRLSAFQSRQRRISIIEDLQKTVATISQENANQQREIQELTAELQSARQENERLRAQLATLANVRETSSTVQHLNTRRSEAAQAPPQPARPSNRDRQEQGLSPAISNFLATAIASGRVSGEVFSLLNELAVIQQQQAILRNNPPPVQRQQANAEAASLTPPQEEQKHGSQQVSEQVSQQQLLSQQQHLLEILQQRNNGSDPFHRQQEQQPQQQHMLALRNLQRHLQDGQQRQEPSQEILQQRNDGSGPFHRQQEQQPQQQQMLVLQNLQRQLQNGQQRQGSSQFQAGSPEALLQQLQQHFQQRRDHASG